MAIINPLFSEEKKILTWADCVKAAEKNNSDLISAREKIIQKDAAKKVVRADLLPQVSATASGEHGKSDADTSNNSVNTYSYGITAKQLLFDGFKTVYDMKSADASLDESRLDYSVTSAAVRLKLRNAFINYIKAEQMYGITLEIRKRRKHIYDLVKIRYEAGKEHVGSLHSVKAELMQAEADVRAAERDISLAHKTLCLIMGVAETRTFKPQDRFEITGQYDSKPDLAILAAKNPSVVKTAHAKQAAYYSLKSSQLDFSPKVYGTASIGKTGESPDDMSKNWTVGFEITAPLFEGGKTWYTESKASAFYRQSESDGKSALNTVLQSLEESWNSLKSAIENVNVQKESLNSAVERSKIGEMQYTIGTMSFDNWTIIESNLASAKKSYLNACANALTAEAQWIQSAGGTLENEIQD
jgi:outer membrane protein TolC